MSKTSVTNRGALGTTLISASAVVMFFFSREVSQGSDLSDSQETVGGIVIIVLGIALLGWAVILFRKLGIGSKIILILAGIATMLSILAAVWHFAFQGIGYLG